MRKFRVLALDGGGIRGLLTVRILRRLCDESGIPNLFDSVDLIAGTSSGGLIALGMAYGLGRSSSAQTLAKLQAMFEDGESTFGGKRLLGGWIQAKYGTDPREKAIKKAVGESTTLGDLSRKVLIPAFDLDNRSVRDGRPDSRKWKPKLFHNFEGEFGDRQVPVWKVALYTTALPIYFPSVDGYIDGGVYANNPSMCALAQLLDPRYPQDPPLSSDHIVMLSIGTGLNLRYLPESTYDRGVLPWGKDLIDLTADSAVGIADYQCKHLLGRQRYHRIAPEFTSEMHVGSDDVRKIDQLKAFADEVHLERAIAWLKENWVAPDLVAKPPRQKEKTSKHLLTTTELTCLAPIRKGFVGLLDTRTYAERLGMVIKALHTLRVGSREAATFKTVVDVVDGIRSIHKFQFAITEDGRHLLLTVTFGGAWEPYMRIIWRDLGPLMDLVLCNCEDYLDNTSDKGFDRFVAYIRRVQVESAFLYSDSALSVDDKGYLVNVERHIQKAAAGDNLRKDILKIVASDPVKTTQAIAAARPEEAQRHLVLLLRVLHGLAELYPPTDSDHIFLLRAAWALLKHGVADVTADQLSAKGATSRELEWLRMIRDKASDPADPINPRSHRAPEAPLRERTAEDAVQGGILKAYKTAGDVKIPATHGCLLLARITNPMEARRFLRDWIEESLTLEPDPGSPREYRVANGAFHNIAFTREGLRSLGLPDDVLEAFPKEFREGMESRAGVLGDVRWNHPDNWVLPEWNVPPLPSSVVHEVPRVRLSTVDIVVQMRAIAPDAGDEWDEHHPLWAAANEFCAESAKYGIRVLSRQLMRDHPEPASRWRVRGHLGFVDGISQPTPGRDGRHHVNMGEVLLGYENDRYDPAYPNPKDAPELRSTHRVRGSILDNGTFLVVRKLQQHVDRMEKVLGDHKDVGSEELLLAKMMGREQDGKPLAVDSGGGQHQNDFDYTQDPHGDKCPLAAHIRRANPRPDPVELPVPRILRRGMSYSDGAERGLFFMAYNASIAEQFEVIQRWVTGGTRTGGFSGHPDPFLGVPDPAEPRIFRFVDSNGEVRSIDLGREPLVTLKWGMYLFVPSLHALRELVAERRTDRSVSLEEQVAAGQRLIPRLQTADDWAAMYESVSFTHSGMSQAVSAAIRATQGGVRRTPYGVIVASERLVMEVLENDALFSVAEYRRRMERSIGQIYLGLDASEAYDVYATRPNAAIQRIRAEDAFHEAWDETVKALLEIVEKKTTPGMFSLEQLADRTIAHLSTLWFDIPDGDCVGIGGRPTGEDRKPRCPFHTIAPSRFIFSSPNPRPAVVAMGSTLGKDLVDGVRRFVAKHQDKQSRSQLKGPLSRALFEAMGDDPEALASNLVGLLEGFAPTVFGNFMKVAHLWATNETLWRLQQDLCSRPEADYHHARYVLERPLHMAMMVRPIPDLLHRTATRDTDLGGVRIRAGERVVLSIAAATGEMLAQGKVSVAPVFGGLRSEIGHPTHACPGYEMAMGVLLGMFAGLLQSGTLSPAQHPFLKLGDPKPFYVRPQNQGAAAT